MNFIEFCEETALKLTPKIRTSLFLQGSIEGFVPASTDSQSDSSRCKMWHVLWLFLCSWAKATWQQIQANSHANANACPHALVQPSTCSSDRTARDTETLERTSRFFFFLCQSSQKKNMKWRVHAWTPVTQAGEFHYSSRRRWCVKFRCAACDCVNEWTTLTVQCCVCTVYL